MWMLQLLHSVLSWSVVYATQINYTIDDASPLVQYRAPVLDRNLTGFNSSLLFNNTVTFIPATAQDSPTISMNFTGTAIYIFVAYPAGHNESFTSGFIARIDDVPSGGWDLPNTAPLVNHLAYRNRTLSNGFHNVTLQIQPEWELYFDYAIYTSGDPDPTPSSSATSSQNTGNPGSSSASTSKKKFPVGAVVGGILGGLLLLALISTPFMLRRWSLRKQKPNPYMVGVSEAKIHGEKETGPPPPTPFTLQSPPRARSKKGDKSELGLGIETRRLMTSTVHSPVSPASEAESPLVLLAEEMRRMRASMQRLETEARDGGPLVQRPPAYGISD
ncbi:hypothetical protein B0H17DRAFT_1061629 [Mycena rosella]|uniref:Uncharacterized protein n=1 Tax=Mycena rosella TaxID=1033263 RepID=A0AAD7DIL3_MYCRO|nr:hypothetical protein B0H17DRAFT_1061629 [Mycena rosella]